MGLSKLGFTDDVDFVYGVCRASELDEIKISCEVKKYVCGVKAKSILHNAKSVILVGNVYNDTEIIKKGILGDDFPSYKASRKQAEEVAKKLKDMGYHAKTTVNVSIKNACILAGIGVWGKNSLIINKEHGTKLRFCCVVTDWEPESYGNKLNTEGFNPCKDCTLCIDACPTHCLEEYKVHGKGCICTFIDKGMRLSQELPMCSVCQDICPFNNKNI